MSKSNSRCLLWSLKNLPDKVLAILPDSSVGMVSSKIRGGFTVSQMLNGAEGSHRRHQLFPGSMAHDAVLVLDPSPGENFGHPVVLFYVDVNVTKKRCSHMDGIYLGELQNSNKCLCEVSEEINLYISVLSLQNKRKNDWYWKGLCLACCIH